MKKVIKIFKKDKLEVIDFDKLMNLILSDEIVVSMKGNKLKVTMDNGTYNYYSTKDKYGQTHLENVLEGSNIANIRLFLDLGFDVNEHGYMGDTAILKVFSILNYSKVYLVSKLLLDHGADPYIVNDNGDSAIDYFQHNFPYEEDGDNRLRKLIEKYYKDFVVEDYNKYPLPCSNEFNLGVVGNVELIDNYSE